MKDIIQAAYYLFERAKLLNNDEQFRTYKSILSSYHREGLLKNSLNPHQKRNIKHIAQKDVLEVLPFIPKPPLPPQSIKIDNAPEDEKDLSDIISRNISVLTSPLGEEVLLQIREVETQYSKDCGYIDMVCRSKDCRTVYVIELKVVKATHEVIGQIQKYLLYYRLQLSLNIFQEVIGVIIAPDYDDFVRDQLLQSGYLVLTYTVSQNSMMVSRIE